MPNGGLSVFAIGSGLLTGLIAWGLAVLFHASNPAAVGGMSGATGAIVIGVPVIVWVSRRHSRRETRYNQEFWDDVARRSPNS